LPAYYVGPTGFLTYSNGFVPATFSGGAAQTGALTLTGTNSYLGLTGASASVSTSGTVAALNTGTTPLTVTAATLTIGNNGSASGLFTTGGGVAGTGTLSFGSSEGIIAYYQQGGTVTISTPIAGSAGLTLTGDGMVSLTGTSPNLSGTLTVGSVNTTLKFTSDTSLGATNAALDINGGILIPASSGLVLNGSRPVIVGTAGGQIQIATSGLTPASLTIAGQLSGPGNLSIYPTSGANYPGVLILQNTTNNFTGTIILTTQQGYAELQVDSGLELGSGTNAAVDLSGGDTVLEYTGATSSTTARGLIFASLGGVIDTWNASGALTVAGPVTGSGMLTKSGSGTLILSGSSTLTGNTDVTFGTLNIQNSYALGASSAVVTGSIGISGGAAFVQSGATLALQNTSGNVNVGYKTLYLNGTGVGNVGALNNVSGANSMAGTVVLQSAASIAAQTGTLTLSGPLMGSSALTKIGTGTLILGGTSPSFTGPTTVQAGTLVVSGSISGSVNVAATGVLNGSGFTGVITGTGGALLTPGGTTTPGILTAPSVTGSTGMAYDFRFTQQGTPTYSNAANSGNDLLNLTSATPFSVSLSSTDVVNIYLATDAPGDNYEGGFLTTLSKSALATQVQNATFNYFVAGSGAGQVTFDGQSYVPISSSMTITLSEANDSVNSVTVSELEFTAVAVPEPGTWGTVISGLVLLGIWQQRAKRTARNYNHVAISLQGERRRSVRRLGNLANVSSGKVAAPLWRVVRRLCFP